MLRGVQVTIKVARVIDGSRMIDKPKLLRVIGFRGVVDKSGTPKCLLVILTT